MRPSPVRCIDSIENPLEPKPFTFRFVGNGHSIPGRAFASPVEIAGQLNFGMDPVRIGHVFNGPNLLR